MTLQADNAYGAGKRFVASGSFDDEDLGVPRDTLPEVSGTVNVGRVKHIDIDISASFNEDDNDIETNATSGNTLMIAKGTSTIVMGEVSGASDENEDFNGLLADGYVNQKVDFTRDDCKVDLSSIPSAAGVVDILAVLEDSILTRWKTLGIQNQLTPDGSRATLTGSVSDTPAP